MATGDGPRFAADAHRAYLMLLARARLRGQLRSLLDASDMVQQTLLQAHRKAGQFRGQTEVEFLGWLRRILANQIAESIRLHFGTDKRDQSRVRSLEAELEGSSARLEMLLADGTASPAQVAERNEQIQLLAEAMERLPEEQRLVVVLRHLESMSFAAICTELGRSLPAVMGLHRRGLARLRELLEPQRDRNDENTPSEPAVE